MLRFDETSAECLVFTYREGLLSAIAHDLQIRVTRFVIEADEVGRAVDARFAADSLRVVCALRDGHETALRPGDAEQIEQSIRRDVLDSDRHPEIRFRSSRAEEQARGYLVAGTLEICGKQRPLEASIDREGDRWVSEVRLHQPDFGIKPYSAMLGALRVKADVLVRVTVNASTGGRVPPGH
jgi:hypothetical protein